METPACSQAYPPHPPALAALSRVPGQASPATAEGHPERRWIHDQQKLWPPSLDPQAGQESVADSRF